MGRLCSVLICDSRVNKSNNENATLFSIPKDESIRKSWTNIVNDWNEIFKLSIREDKIKHLKSRLDSLIKEERWEVDDIFAEHNYHIASTRDSITYYICGYLLRQIIKRTTCDICLSAFKEGDRSIPEASITNIKSRGGLIFPNRKIFEIIIGLEEAFEQFCDSYDVFQETVDFFIENNQHLLAFPCTNHKNEIFLFIITYYVTMRMRQYSRISNQKQVKNHAKKKKLSKLLVAT
ncbi:uncharacterized protein LOC111035795 [Myzus persicae]|uniref:uncharacterized protein LOC111035795 n=1 Tax=Myzus persicae TaxID=13164 RepID=UPI000B933919|nr:uncharacterized protein LOC111035795 [Myzus persicae]